MKKILAMLIAFTAVFSTFTACGDEPESSVSEISESSIAESSEEETEPAAEAETTVTEKVTAATETTVTVTTVTETTATVTTDTVTTAVEQTQENKKDIPENPNAETEYAEEYITALKKIFEAEINSDAMAMIELAFPASVADAMQKTGMIDMMLEQIGDVNNELAIEQLENYESIDIRVVGTKEIDSSDLEFVRKQYSSIKGMCDCMIDAGITYDMLMTNNFPENLTEEEILKLAENINLYSDEDADFELTVDFLSYEYVTFALNNETIELPVFIDESGAAKIDLIMIGSSFMG